MTADRNSDKTCINLLFLLLYHQGIEAMGVTEYILQKSQLLEFYSLFVRVYRGKRLLLLKFLINLYEISHDDRKDFIITNNYSTFAFLGKKCGFWIKIIASLKATGLLYRINSYGFRKHSLKIWAWSDHFSRFHRYWKFKIQRNKSKWCKTFFEEYNYYLWFFNFYDLSIWTCCCSCLAASLQLNMCVSVCIDFFLQNVHCICCEWEGWPVYRLNTAIEWSKPCKLARPNSLPLLLCNQRFLWRDYVTDKGFFCNFP